MFNWVKEFFRAKEAKVDSKEAEKRVYERQREHHKRKMEASPSRYDFHRSMVEHCDTILDSTPSRSVVGFADNGSSSVTHCSSSSSSSSSGGYSSSCGGYDSGSSCSGSSGGCD